MKFLAPKNFRARRRIAVFKKKLKMRGSGTLGDYARQGLTWAADPDTVQRYWKPLAGFAYDRLGEHYGFKERVSKSKKSSSSSSSSSKKQRRKP